MLEKLKNLQDRLQKLSKKRIQIKAGGRYPNSGGTRVAQVAKWQNDGTSKVSPARFVERAAASHDGWSVETAQATWDFLTGGGDVALLKLGLRISDAISATCDRIDTGRLKRSFTPEIKNR